MKLNIQTIIYTEEHKKQTRWNVRPGWASDEALTISAVRTSRVLVPKPKFETSLPNTFGQKNGLCLSPEGAMSRKY